MMESEEIPDIAVERRGRKDLKFMDETDDETLYESEILIGDNLIQVSRFT